MALDNVFSVQQLFEGRVFRVPDYQRGYAWDNPHFCIYSNLSSNILAPAGNFLGTNAAGIPTAVPVQLRYPYGVWTNQNEVGYTPVLQPFQLTVNLNVKL